MRFSFGDAVIEMSTVVYLLCALTSLLCSWLLLQGYRRSRTRLLLWSGLCFAGFFVNNVLLIVDLRVLPERDLSIIRILPVLVGLALLIYGMVWDSYQ
jgi:uncharacterized protein DUF5985